MLQEPTKCKI